MCIRDSLGGKTTINCDAFVSKDLENGNHMIDTTDPAWHQKHDVLCMLDVNGMYPATMKAWEMPYGVPEWGTFADLDRIAQILSTESRYRELLTMYFIARVDDEGRPRKDVLTRCPHSRWIAGTRSKP
mgnify:CR=1 FL=1